jgi:hypothetical protein
MKKLITLWSITFIMLYCTINSVLAQSSTAVNTYASGKFLGWNTNSGDLDIKTKNIVRARFLDASGFLGIGDLTSFVPKNLEHLHRDANIQVYSQFTNELTGSADNDGLLVGINSSGNAVLNQQENLPMLLSTNNSERMRITSTGNIGVNTTAPTRRLDINGDLRIRTLNTNITSTQLLVDAGDGTVEQRDASTLGFGSGNLNSCSTASTNFITLFSSANEICNSIMQENINRIFVGFPGAIPPVAPEYNYSINIQEAIAPQEEFINCEVSDRPDVNLQLLNGFSNNGSFLPTILGTNRATTGTVHSRSLPSLYTIGNIIDTNDTNTFQPVTVFLSGRNFVPGVQTSALQVMNRPIFGWDNGNQRRMIMLANGFLGLNTNAPTSRVDIDGDLRVRNIPNDDVLTRILVSDIDGNVNWRDASTLSVTTGAENGASVNAGGNVVWGNDAGDPGRPAELLDDREIPMNGHNVFFSNGTLAHGNNQVNIGIASTSDAKLGVFDDQELVGILGETDNTAPLIDREAAVKGSYNGELSGVSAPAYYPSVNMGVYGFNRIATGTYMNLFAYGTKGYVTGLSANRANIIGAMGETNTSDATRAYGVVGLSTGANDVNVGVVGEAFGGGTNLAALFLGDVDITGTATIATIISPSDSGLKKDIKPLANAVTIINQLQPKTYHYDAQKFPQFKFGDKLQYGLLAQSLEKVLPDLVYDQKTPAKYNDKGEVSSPSISYKAINYIGLIPVMIEAIKEQDKKIQEKDAALQAMEDRLKKLEDMIYNTSGKTNGTVKDITLGNDVMVLEQNVPNPFAEKTTISYYIPLDADFAQILFYDQMGKQIGKVDITEKGNGQLNVFADDLHSGIYSYTLVIDGKAEDTKRMVCIK